MKRMSTNHFPLHRVAGFGLIEVLVAFLVMAVGLVALLRFHSFAQENIAEAKTQAEAAALAEAKLQEIESFLRGDDTRMDANLGDGSDNPDGQLATYTRSWNIVDSDPTCNIATSGTCLKTAEVTIAWDNRQGEETSVTLSSAIQFRQPTRGVQGFVRLVSAADAAGGGASHWRGDEEDDDDEEEDGGQEDDEPGEDGDNPPPEEGGEGEQAITYYQIRISGDIETHQGGEFGSVGGSGNFTVNCVHSGSDYSCIANVATGSTWTGMLYYTAAERTLCTPPGGSIVFEAITADQQQDVCIANNCAVKC